MGKILLYTENDFKAESIKSLCSRLRHGFVRIGADEINCSLASFLSGKPKAVSGCRIPVLYSQPELLVLGGLASAEIDTFLEEYRKENIGKTELKAVVTPSNCMWSVYELTGELIKENRRMTL